MTMKFASFQIDAAGDLVMSLGWGHGGSAVKRLRVANDTPPTRLAAWR